MTFDGQIHYPPGFKLGIDPARLAPLRDELTAAFFGRVKADIKHKPLVVAGVRSHTEPGAELIIQFRRVGDTTALLSMGYESGEGDPDMQVAVALLTRLDAESDSQALDRIRSKLTEIPDESFEAARDHPAPLAAAFFVDETAMNDPLIHTTISVVAAAFFDLFGIGT